MTGSVEKQERTSEKYKHAGVTVSIIKHDDFREYFVNVDLLGVTELTVALAETFGYLKKSKAKIISQMVFGDCASKEKIIKKIVELNGGVDWPVMAMEHDSGEHYQLSGMQFVAVSGVSVKELKIKETVLGFTFEDKNAKYAYLTDVRPSVISKSKEEQTKEVYEKALLLLKQAGMDFSNVVRTWFYLDRLLSWYKEFNDTRTGFYNKNDIFTKLVPASTGIGAKNPEGAELVTGFYAVKPKNQSVSVFKVDSPLQSEAINYESAFSRAIEITTAGSRKLLISGTASITKDGASTHIGELEKQLELTMRIVGEILKARSMIWENVTRAILYFRNRDAVTAFSRYCEKNAIPVFPAVTVYSTVCREELLFEIEVDAIAEVSR
jgi:enamine deaminase RidA (YjgF/YER057c/UK114 family)